MKGQLLILTNNVGTLGRKMVDSRISHPKNIWPMQLANGVLWLLCKQQQTVFGEVGTLHGFSFCSHFPFTSVQSSSWRNCKNWRCLWCDLQFTYLDRTMNITKHIVIYLSSINFVLYVVSCKCFVGNNFFFPILGLRHFRNHDVSK